MTQDKQIAFAAMVGRIEDQLTVIPILTQNVLETESAEWLQRFAANVAELIKSAERAIAAAKSELKLDAGMNDAASDWTKAWRIVAEALKEMGCSNIDSNAKAIIARLAGHNLLIVDADKLND